MAEFDEKTESNIERSDDSGDTGNNEINLDDEQIKSDGLGEGAEEHGAKEDEGIDFSNDSSDNGNESDNLRDQGAEEYGVKEDEGIDFSNDKPDK